MTNLIPAARITLLIAAGGLLGGCATSKNPNDPFENFNRPVFAFNDAVDRSVLKPAATTYKKVLPTFAQTGVNNFFGNLQDGWSGVNNLLQGKGQDGMSDITRFAFNSTFGLFGVLDIASEAGLQKHNEDFGQTLGKWGVKSGPYLMLPLLGPSTVRDAVVIPLDRAGDGWNYVDPVNVRNIGTAVDVVDQRAVLLDASELVEGAALDRYEFIRDGFLQRRESQVNDGQSPRARGQKDDGPSDAASIKAAYEDDPGPTAAPADSAKPVSSKPATK